MRSEYIKILLCLTICLGMLPVARASDSKLLYGIPNSKYYLELAKVHQRYGHFDEAIEMYEKAIEAETDESEKNKLKIGLGRSYLLANRAEDAEKTILEALEAERDIEKKADYYLNLGEVYETLNRSDKAIEAYEFVLGNCTDNILNHTARQKLTKLLKSNGTLKEYVSLLEKKLEEDPEDIMVMECLARAYSINETNNEKILPLYEKLFDAKPGDHAYTYGYYPLDPGEIYDGEPMIMFSENFDLVKGETYTIIIE